MANLPWGYKIFQQPADDGGPPVYVLSHPDRKNPAGFRPVDLVQHLETVHGSREQAESYAMECAEEAEQRARQKARDEQA